MKLEKTVLLAGVVAATVISGAAQAAESDYKGFQAGDIMVRGRALAVLPNVSSNVSAIGGHVEASNSVVPEVDVTYFFTPNIAVEAIGAISRHHLVDKGSSAGNVDLGRVTLLPPTVTAQYHFLTAERISPYVGAGINYTVFFDHELPAGSAATSIHYDNRFAAAIQAGVDFHVQGNWYANFDVKHIFLNTKASINGGSIIGDVSIDPTIIGLGVGYKF